MTRKLPPAPLPRETNVAKVRSAYRRSVRLVRDASATFRENPHRGTQIRRIDRILAALALREKVRFVKVRAGMTGHRKGGIRLSAMKGAARKYRAALARWQKYYFEKVSA